MQKILMAQMKENFFHRLIAFKTFAILQTLIHDFQRLEAGFRSGPCSKNDSFQGCLAPDFIEGVYLDDLKERKLTRERNPGNGLL